MQSVGQSLPTTPYNPYLDDSNTINPLASNGNTFYQSQAAYTATAQPLQYHLYAPVGPHREDLLPYQKVSHDFFIPEKIREDLQKKSEASLQVMPSTYESGVVHDFC